MRVQIQGSGAWLIPLLALLGSGIMIGGVVVAMVAMVAWIFGL